MSTLITFNKSHMIWEIPLSNVQVSVARYQGVFLDKRGYLVACDGYVLAAIPCEVSNPLEEIMIPPNIIQQAATTKHGDTQFTIDDKNASARLDDGTLITTPLLDQDFPRHWTSIIPKESGQVSYYCVSSRLHVKLLKAIGKWDNHTPLSGRTASMYFSNSPNDAAIILGTNGAFGLLMPISVAPNTEEINKIRALANL